MLLNQMYDGTLGKADIDKQEVKRWATGLLIERTGMPYAEINIVTMCVCFCFLLRLMSRFFCALKKYTECHFRPESLHSLSKRGFPCVEFQDLNRLNRLVRHLETAATIKNELRTNSLIVRFVISFSLVRHARTSLRGWKTMLSLLCFLHIMCLCVLIFYSNLQKEETGKRGRKAERGKERREKGEEGKEGKERKVEEERKGEGRAYPFISVTLQYYLHI